ncbi:NgoMIV family type II restriction endonuclease [Nocardiopsis sp. LOL_012]|uniref:NgoMIV family type II restriction endonuclease n=1 Tax=Nocardiopsis sp. LOL_012 TaxID=3345409 RepID=UPI003A8B1B78
MTSVFAKDLLGWRKPSGKGKYVPNCADSHSAESIKISEGMLLSLGLDPSRGNGPPLNPGPVLESSVRDDIEKYLLREASWNNWEVACGGLVTDFSQYSHLKRVDELVRDSPELRIAIGQDYLIRPDVTVGVAGSDGSDKSYFLHAAISCKWTIRSDRVQNIRHEFNQMIRHCRGRQPHLVSVTAEPLSSRLAAIARGTGEVDAVYHVAFDALRESVDGCANPAQKEAWHECVEQGRLLSYVDLPGALARW